MQNDKQQQFQPIIPEPIIEQQIISPIIQPIIEPLIEPLIEPIIEPIIETSDYDLIPSSLIDGLCTLNSTDLAPITMELPDMLFQESPVKLNDVEEPIDEPEEEIPEPEILMPILEVPEPIAETVPVPTTRPIPDLVPVTVKPNPIVEEPEKSEFEWPILQIESIKDNPEIFEILSDDEEEDILEVIYLGKRPEFRFKKPQKFLREFPEYEANLSPIISFSEMEQPVVNPINRSRQFPGVRKWYCDLPAPSQMPTNYNRRFGGGISSNKKKLLQRQTLLQPAEKPGNQFEMTTKKNGENSGTGTNLFQKSMEMNSELPAAQIDQVDGSEPATPEETNKEILLRCLHDPELPLLKKLIKHGNLYSRRVELQIKIEKAEREAKIIAEFPEDTDKEQRKELEAKIAHVEAVEPEQVSFFFFLIFLEIFWKNQDFH